MNPLIQLKQATPLFVISLVLACFGLSPLTQAVTPPPDGGYPTGNTAEGQSALLSLSTGAYNTAVGVFSLLSDTTNSFNTAIGAGTLLANTADQNTATGAGALLSNTTGTQNTANGAFALFSNTTGNFNAANGVSALFSNTTGLSNTATGDDALLNNTTGSQNTATGVNALQSNTIGLGNTANGFRALLNNTTGTANTADGAFALSNNTTGGGNTALGEAAGNGVVTANSVICIGALGADVTGTTWIGNIYQTTTVSGTTLPVIISDQGQLGTTPSSRRFKTDIQAMDTTSETILALRPVTFHYKSDKTRMSQFGLIAEDVAEVNADLVVRDNEGKPYSVRYDQVNAMLLNEFLKEHRKVEQLEKRVEALSAGLQKVSAQLEASKASPQVVNNP